MTATAKALMADIRANLERVAELLGATRRKVEQAEKIIGHQAVEGGPKVFNMPAGIERVPQPGFDLSASGARRPPHLVPVVDASLPRAGAPDRQTEETIVAWLKSGGWNVASVGEGRWSLAYGARRRTVDRIGLLEEANAERRRFKLPIFAYGGPRHG